MKKIEFESCFSYTVYDNVSGICIAENKTSKECAELMGIRISSWYKTVHRCKNGENKRWTILKHDNRDKIRIKVVKEKYRVPLTGMDGLPIMVRVTQLADVLSTTPLRVVDLCEKLGVPIVMSGKNKIRFVSRDKFFKRLKQGVDNE